MLDFGQINDLINAAIKSYNDEITRARWIQEGAGQTYEDYMKSLDNAYKKQADHRNAAEIDRDTAAIFAAAGM